MDFSFTAYFETKVLAKRPYLTREMRVRVVRSLCVSSCKKTVSG